MSKFIKARIQVFDADVYIDLSKIAIVYPEDNVVVITATHGLGSGNLKLEEEDFKKVLEYVEGREFV